MASATKDPPKISGEPLVDGDSYGFGKIQLSVLPYRPWMPKLNADPASATDIPKKNPLGAGAA
jgi:hypothetical protein